MGGRAHSLGPEICDFPFTTGSRSYTYTIHTRALVLQTPQGLEWLISPADPQALGVVGMLPVVFTRAFFCTPYVPN